MRQLRQAGSYHRHRRLLDGRLMQCGDDGGELIFLDVLEFVHEQGQDSLGRSRSLSRGQQQGRQVVMSRSPLSANPGSGSTPR